MKEIPILFSGPMVRAILDGRKTMTRRLVDMRKYPEFTRPEPMRTNVPGATVWMNPDDPIGTMVIRRCPFGVPGDRLWVRETWAWSGVSKKREDGDPWYRATHYKGEDAGINWRPSIHMPRWACRTVLEVASVRVERLQEISEGDAVDEGWPVQHEVEHGCEGPEAAHFQGTTKGDWARSGVGDGDGAIEWFADLWESINGKGSWDVNPWVWVVEFTRKEPTP